MFYKSLILIILLCGCQHNKINSFNPNASLAAERDNLLMQRHTTNFADGYIDGCQSGRVIAGDNNSQHIKDESRINLDKEYCDGWDQGYTFCYEHMRDMLANSKHPYTSMDALEEEKRRLWEDLRK